MMDKAYDSNAIRQTLREKEILAVIPPRKNRVDTIDYDKQYYKQRDLLERFIGRILSPRLRGRGRNFDESRLVTRS